MLRKLPDVVIVFSANVHIVILYVFCLIIDYFGKIEPFSKIANFNVSILHTSLDDRSVAIGVYTFRLKERRQLQLAKLQNFIAIHNNYNIILCTRGHQWRDFVYEISIFNVFQKYTISFVFHKYFN